MANKWAWLALLAAICGSLAVAGCGGEKPQAPGNRGGLRIVSLAPSTTEILYAIHCGESLVGVTDRCDFPPEAKGVEQVGGFGTPNAERVLAIAPDLVVSCGWERPEVARMLRKSGVCVLDVRVRRFDDLFKAIHQVGDAVGRPQRADEAIAGLRRELAVVANRKRTGKPLRVFIEIGDHPLMTAGGGSYLDDMVALAGGVNAAHDLPDAYPCINPEVVVTWNPDVALVAGMEQPGEAAARMARRIGWAEIPAMKNGCVIDDIDPDLLLRPGPRLIEGVKALAERLDEMAHRGKKVSPR